MIPIKHNLNSIVEIVLNNHSYAKVQGQNISHSQSLSQNNNKRPTENFSKEWENV